MTERQLEHWAIGLPVESSLEKCIKKLSVVERKFSGCCVSIMDIPKLRMGTLDSLMLATDELLSLHEKAEGLLIKLIDVCGHVINKKRSQLVNDLFVEGQDMFQFLKNFQWDFAKYSINHTIKGLCDVIERQLNQTNTDLAKMSFDYFESFNELKVVQQRLDCSLVHKDVSLIVKKEDFVLNSLYLTTALVVVPRNRYTEWKNCYERLDREVVPRSSFLISEDEENGLYTVTLFKRHFDVFKERAMELKFVVKDFTYDEEKIEETRDSIFRARRMNKKLHVPFVRWLKANFSETYIAMVHIQALRVAVESVLRYGLPANFFSVVLSISKSDTTKLLEYLKNEYEYVDESLKSIIGRLRYDESDDAPFVYVNISGEMFFFNK